MPMMSERGVEKLEEIEGRACDVEEVRGEGEVWVRDRGRILEPQ